MLIGTLVLAIGCSSTGDSGAQRRDASTTSTTHAKAATAAPTTPPISTVTGGTASAPSNPDATGSILMVKLYVADLGKAQAFYHDVFGATLAVEMGAHVHIVTFPNGGPVLLLLYSLYYDTDKKGSFIMKVPTLATTKPLALAHGAREQGTFAGAPGGQAAKSVDLLDPWGNQVEILQLG